MKWILWLGLAMCFVAPSALKAQSPFDGTWKLDPDSAQIQAKPEVYLLKDGKYDCLACEPPLHVRANGREQKITGDVCFDTVSVNVIDDRTVEEIYRKDGKTVGTSKMTVSSNGQTATMDWSERCNVQGDLVAIKRIMRRVAPAPEGAHAVSGSWLLVKRESASDNVFIATLKLDGDTFNFSDPAGQGYTAKLDGTETSWRGELGNQKVSVRRIGTSTIEEISKQDGKVVEIVRYTLSADGKTMTISIENAATGSTSTYTAKKQ